MPTGSINQVASVGGLTIQSTVTRTASSQIGHETTPPLPAAKAGTLSTRISDTAGVLTLSAGHGMAKDEIVDIFWLDANGVGKCAYGGTVDAPTWLATTAYSLGDYVEPTTPNDCLYECTTAGTTGASEPSWPTVDGETVADGGAVWTCRTANVPVAGASGEVLPALDYAITASEPTTIDTDFDGDLLEMIAASATYLGHVSFCDVGDVVLKPITLPGEPWVWISDQGITNPLAGNPVAYALLSNGDAALANTIKVGVLYNGQS